MGVIGCGEVAQTVHIPNLNHFNEYFKITYLCDVSRKALAHCQGKVAGSPPPRLTMKAEEVCSSPEVDVVFIIDSTEYHTPHAVLALQNDKIAFIEKPMVMNERDARLILEAESRSKGTVMVGYMRRYATAFLDAVKELGGFEEITYARIRDIIGLNAFFVDQSGTFSKKFTDYSAEDSDELKARAQDLVHQGLTQDLGIEVTKENEKMWALLGGLGSHDLSAMREALGMPQHVLGCSLNAKRPCWVVLFQYPHFVCTYESYIHHVPRFDAHVEIYSKTKQVQVQYDTPYVKGLPVTLTIRENINGGYQEKIIRPTYEDPYTLEYKELYALVTEAKPVKTTAQDAVQDLKIFQMIMKAGKSQVNLK